MNNKKQWTDSELEFLQANRSSLTCRDLAGALKRTIVSVERKLARVPNPHPKPAPVKKGPAENESHVAYWKKLATEAQRKLAAGQHDATAVEQLVAKAVELAPIAYVPPKKTRPPEKKSAGTPQSAVLMFSDTHVGAVVSPDQTLGLGNYSFEIFLRRLARLERSVTSIIKDHTLSKVPEIVVAMMGDMIDGALNHGVEAGQTATLFEQFYAASHSFAQFFRNLSVLAPIRIETACGNHPRFAHQKRTPSYNRFSNLDFFCYHYVQALLRDCPRVTMNLTANPYAEFSVAGYSFLASHGDEYRGGDRALGIPSHAVARRLSNVSQNFNAAGKKIPNYYICGHLHRSISLPHAGGSVLVNGGFVGTDGYALAEGFNASKPSQRFFLMHEKFGKAASYDIRLDLGDDQPHGYDLPNNFSCQ